MRGTAKFEANFEDSMTDGQARPLHPQYSHQLFLKFVLCLRRFANLGHFWGLKASEPVACLKRAYAGAKRAEGAQLFMQHSKTFWGPLPLAKASPPTSPHLADRKKENPKDKGLLDKIKGTTPSTLGFAGSPLSYY